MGEPDVSSLLTVQQAIRILDQTPVAPRTRRVPLDGADGLRLAHAVVADRDYPPFDKSQMDGFAVRQEDVRSAPVELQIVGEVAAGETAKTGLASGQAMSIMTGAPLPVGADAVVPVEDTERTGESAVRILRSDTFTRFVAHQGSDCRAGQDVLTPGVRIGPAQIAVAATVGATGLEVFEKPRVAVLSTGDELVPVTSTPQGAQIRNSNSPMLVSLLRRMGCDVTDLGSVPDDKDTIRAALQSGLSFDALFVTGGMSMGEYDYVPRLLVDLGVELKVTKLRIKPGKPFVFGTFPSTSGAPAPSCCVFGLPGNPVSSFVCASRLAGRVLSRMAGGPVEERWLSGRLDNGLPVNGPREFYQPAIRTVAPGRDSTHGEFATITPLKWTGSADLFTLARANVLLVRPENDPPLPKGTILRILEIL
jgi:molybdopterin molybdotransferase